MLKNEFQKNFFNKFQNRPVLDNEKDYRRAAVLVPLIKTEDGYSLLFEVRAATLSWQPGDICFPGGSIEKMDASYLDAAIRETCEELNLSPSSIEVLGALNYLVLPIGIMLHPFIGYIKDPKLIHPNKDEVAEIFSVPLSYFERTPPLKAKLEVATMPSHGFPFHLLPDYQKDWKTRTDYDVYFYKYKNYVIWGLTARIVNMVIKDLKEFQLDF